MNNTIRELSERIASLRERLAESYEALAKEYGYSLKGRRVVFLENIRERNRALKVSAWKYLTSKKIRHLLSMPFIYMMIVPAVVLDVFVTVYQWAAFPLYRIPKVNRRDFIVYDRRYLDYLNFIDKANCLYCSYVNGLFGYAVEIAARSERYWCPIKAARNPRYRHGWYEEFADYGSPEQWEKKFNDDQSFADAYANQKCFRD